MTIENIHEQLEKIDNKVRQETGLSLVVYKNGLLVHKSIATPPKTLQRRFEGLLGITKAVFGSHNGTKWYEALDIALRSIGNPLELSKTSPTAITTNNGETTLLLGEVKDWKRLAYSQDGDLYYGYFPEKGHRSLLPEPKSNIYRNLTESESITLGNSYALYGDGICSLSWDIGWMFSGEKRELPMFDSASKRYVYPGGTTVIWGQIPFSEILKLDSGKIKSHHYFPCPEALSKYCLVINKIFHRMPTDADREMYMSLQQYLKTI